MKIHTTNYINTFIAIADDCPATQGEVPPKKADARSVANIQFELIHKNPYKFSSDDVLFKVYAEKKDLTSGELEKAREEFFSKGQPCMRASPLTKRYGWGVHNNEEGRVALVGCESKEYERLLDQKTLKIVRAMKSSR